MSETRTLFISRKHFYALRKLMRGEKADVVEITGLLDLKRSKSLAHELAQSMAHDSESDYSKFCTAVNIDYAYVTYLANSRTNQLQLPSESSGREATGELKQSQEVSDSYATQVWNEAIQFSGVDNLSTRLQNEQDVRAERDSQEIAFTQVANRYYREEPLGKGAFGSVFACEDSSTGKSVALKLIRADARIKTAESRILSISEDDREYKSVQNDREAVLLACLEHPNILTCLDWGDATNVAHYLVTEKCSTTVRELIRTGRLTLAKSIELLIGVAEALEFMHSQGVIHRDIKPDNILVDANGWPRIADFGLAVFMHENVMGIAGTIPYMSPEQINSEWFDGRSDVYSLGVTAYEMLTGLAPYGSIGRNELIELVRTGSLTMDISALSKLPSKVVEVLEYCTQKLPARRCFSRELVTMLRNVQASLDLPTATGTPQDELTRLSVLLHTFPADSTDRLKAYGMLGDAFNSRQFQKAAICCWWRSARMARDLRNFAVEAEMTWRISQCCFQVGDITKAKIHAATAFDLAKNTDQVLATEISQRIALWSTINDE